MPGFKPSLLSLAIAAATTMTAQAWAQGATNETTADGKILEEVVVTARGFRKSIIDSIGTKRDSASVVEAISAEDIGKLPDSSIAESIARLPGLAAQRLDGRSSSISIRGLGQDFSATTFNGREQVSISDNRGVEFDIYPSEIMAGVTVYKSPDASLATQGIAGVINLHSVKPLDYDERVVKVNGSLENADLGKLNPDSDDQGHRATFSYVDQFNDGKVGVALALATMESPSQEERWNAWGYPDSDTGNVILGGAKPFVRSSILARDTVMGVVQFQPGDQLSITADALYIDFSDEKTLRGLEIPAQWGGGGITESTVVDGFVTEGILHNRAPQVRNDFEKRAAELTAFGFNANYDFSDDFSLEVDLAHSEVERQVWSLESYSGFGRPTNDARPLDEIGFTMQGDQGVSFSPMQDYTDAKLIQLGGAQSWGNGNTVPNDGQDGFINIPKIEDELDSLRLVASKMYDDSFISGVEVGLNYSDRTKQKDDDGIFLTLPQYPGTSAIPEEYIRGTTSLSFIGIPGMIAYDSFSFWKDGNYIETPEGLTVDSRSINDWEVTEKVTIAFVKADFVSELGGMELTGNIGVQVVDTDQSSKGKAVSVNDEGIVEIIDSEGGDKYTEVLPSLNVSLSITEEQKLRFAASRTMSRSRMDRMNAGIGYGFDDQQNQAGGRPFQATGGNPELRPNLANQFDIAYEYYFSEEGYVSVSAFHKDLKSWQVQQDVDFDMADLVDPSLFGPEVLSTLGQANVWTSANGGKIDGFEVATVIPGNIIADALDGFGIIASASFNNSSLDTESGDEVPVPGLSEKIFNTTFYYEKNGFQARASMRDRSDFLGERFGTSFTKEDALVDGSVIWDAQIGYDFSDSDIKSLEGLAISFQAQNMTDEPYVTRDPGNNLIKDHQVYGRTYLLGASYSF